jgi:hypothetical protein
VIGRLTWEIHVGNTVLPAIGGTVSIDDQNIPAITASVMAPYDPDIFAALDPRTREVPRATVTCTLKHWSSKPLSAMSEYAATQGGTIADLSDAWDGLTLAHVSNVFGSWLYDGAPTKPDTLSLNLHVREVSHDHFTMTISLASDEALLTDWAVTGPFDAAAIQEAMEGRPTNRAATYVDAVLLRVLGRETVTTPWSVAAVSGDFDFDILDLLSGPTAWEIIRQALDDSGVRLRPLRNGYDFGLYIPESSMPKGPRDSDMPNLTWEKVISARWTYTRTRDWYDSVNLVAGGAIGASSGSAAAHTRTYREDVRTGSHATLAMAQYMLQRAQNRGRLLELVTPIRPGAYMRDQFYYTPAEGEAAELWITKAVSYDLATGTMTVLAELY